MSRSSLRIPAYLRSSVSLALAAAMVVGAGAAETPKGSAGAAGALSITTEPDNADVYVDGRLAGQTPASVASLAAGEHRVRIVKSGYLENARIVTLAAGEPTHLNVRLTKTNETAAGQVTSTGGGGGSKKWLYIAAAGGAAAVAAVLLSNKNHAPTPGTATVTPTGTGIAAVTSFAFTSQGASDEDGDSLTISWNFGDGGTATGTTVSHVFANAGTFNVSATVSDGKTDAKAPDLPITIRNVNGTWTSNLQGVIRTWTLTQAGAAVSGSYTSNAAPGVPGNVSGTLSSLRAFNGTAMLTGFAPFSAVGSFDASVSTLSVVVNGSGFTGETMTFNRQ